MSTLKSAPWPWQTPQDSPSVGLVFTEACAEASLGVWQAVQAAVVGGVGLMKSVGLLTAIRVDGTGGKSEMFTWHLPQSRKSAG
jgi:hypothetical protein